MSSTEVVSLGGMSATDTASLRRRALPFGLGTACILIAAGAWLAFRREAPLSGVFAAGLGLVVLGLALVAPGVALGLRAGWMKLAAALGWVNTRIILGLMFFGVFTPIALVRRPFQEDRRFRRSKRQSFWSAPSKPFERGHYEHPY